MTRGPTQALVARDDDSDDVRWAVQAALAQLKQGGHADAIVWVKRAADAALAAGKSARGDELKAAARSMAEAMWNLSSPQPSTPPSKPPSVRPQPSSSGSLEIEIDIELSESMAPGPPSRPPRVPSVPPPLPQRGANGPGAKLRPPPGARPQSPSDRPSALDAPTGFAEPPPQYQRIEQTAPRRPLASAPELEVEELDPEALGFSLDEVTRSMPAPSSAPPRKPSSVPPGALRPSFNDRLSSVDIEPLSVDAVIPGFDRLDSKPPASMPPGPDSVRRALALIDDEEILEEEEDERVTQDLGFVTSGPDGLPYLPGSSEAPSPPSTPPGWDEAAVAARVGSSRPPTSAPPAPSAPPTGLSPESRPPPSRGLAARRASLAPALRGSGRPRSVPPPAPVETSPSSVAPSSVAPSSVAPSSVAPSSVAPSSVAPSSVAPSSVAPSSVAPSSVPASVAPSSVVPNSARPSARPDSVRANGSGPSVPPLAVASEIPASAPPLSSRSPQGRRSRAPLTPLDELTLEVADLGPAEPAEPIIPVHAAIPSSLIPKSTLVDGVGLDEVRGFEDLPAEVQYKLAASARVEELAAGEEVAFFGAAVVTAGTVDILPAISEDSGAIAHQHDVVFTRGTMRDSIALRVVAKMDETRVAVWDPDVLEDAIAECPWVHDELRFIADRFLALCGAALGPLGERLDESLRAAVFARLDVRALQPNEMLINAGESIPSLFVVGGGRLEVVDASGQAVEELDAGAFVYPDKMMTAQSAPDSVRAGPDGALLLYAPRSVAHELMMSVPPLLEVLAG